jgi:hypothetical protein
MFYTAFIWGLGVSSGACFGLLMFFVLKSGLDWLMNTKTYKRIEEVNQRTLDLLEDRNKLTDLMAGHLEVIAHASERYKLTDDEAV